MWADVVYEINGKKVLPSFFLNWYQLETNQLTLFLAEWLTDLWQSVSRLLAESLKGEEPSFCIFFAVSRKGLLAFDN